MVHDRLQPIAAWLLPLLMLHGAGCGTAPDGAPSTTVTGAWEAVDTLDTQAFRDAWIRPDTMDHERTVRVELLDGSGGVVAFRERSVRFSAADSSIVLVRQDSSGSFDFGVLGSFADADPTAAPSSDPVPVVLPGDAPFLYARNREKYAVGVQADEPTEGWRIEIRAVPGPGDREAVARVVYGTTRSGLLTAVEIEREDRALLFTDHSHAVARTVSDGSGGLLPVTYAYETRIRPRVGKERRFRVTTAWTLTAAGDRGGADG